MCIPHAGDQKVICQILELNDEPKVDLNDFFYFLHTPHQSLWRRNYENNSKLAKDDGQAENIFVGIFPSFTPNNLKCYFDYYFFPAFLSTWITFFPAFFGRTNHFTWNHNESLQGKCYFDYYFVYYSCLRYFHLREIQVSKECRILCSHDELYNICWFYLRLL